MSRICMVTGKKPVSGNNVSHANNRQIISLTVLPTIVIGNIAQGGNSVVQNGKRKKYLPEIHIAKITNSKEHESAQMDSYLGHNVSRYIVLRTPLVVTRSDFVLHPSCLLRLISEKIIIPYLYRKFTA